MQWDGQTICQMHELRSDISDRSQHAILLIAPRFQRVPECGGKRTNEPCDIALMLIDVVAVGDGRTTVDDDNIGHPSGVEHSDVVIIAHGIGMGAGANVLKLHLVVSV